MIHKRHLCLPRCPGCASRLSNIDTSAGSTAERELVQLPSATPEPSTSTEIWAEPGDPRATAAATVSGMTRWPRLADEHGQMSGPKAVEAQTLA